jgi:hypothetical protein
MRIRKIIIVTEMTIYCSRSCQYYDSGGKGSQCALFREPLMHIDGINPLFERCDMCLESKAVQE